MSPLVSVVCLCYNHQRFVVQAIQSVLNQTHDRVELVVVDDCSTDGSREAINHFIQAHPRVKFIALSENVGNCKAFNMGYKSTNGNFIIDLAADDVLMPDRIEVGLKMFLEKGEKTGVHFSDAEIIDGNGKLLRYHSDRFPHASVPQGDIYAELVRRYFINSPTMMFRREVLEKLGGYDETLAYEDFDFWVRSSRDYQYFYSSNPLVKRRILPNSLSKRQYIRRSIQMLSTFRVCEKARLLNRNQEENQALKKRIRYEFAQAIRTGTLKVAFMYMRLWSKIP